MKSFPSSILIWLITFTFILHSVVTYRILALFTAPFYSHFLTAVPILQKLLERGHDLAIVSGYSFSVNETWRGNATFIKIPELCETSDHTLESNNLWETVTLFNPLMYQYKWVSIENKKMVVLKKSANHILFGGTYDAIFIEDLGTPAFYALADYHECPYIGFSPGGRNPEGRLSNFQHLILHPTTDESEVLFGLHGAKSFIDRFLCLVHDLLKVILYTFDLRDKLESDQPDLYGLLTSYNVKTPRTGSDVHLQAVHPALDFHRPMFKKTIQIGFPHIRTVRSLPSDLLNYLNSSKHGVIYVSFGSIINSKVATNSAMFNMTALQNALSRVELNVIWKWDDTVMKDKPKNAKLFKWIPQQDLIAHEKVKLVICHGGIKTIAESVYHEKPLLVIPFLWDQQANAERVRNLGVGKFVLKHEIIEEEMVNDVIDLIHNQSYRDVLKELSAVIRDTPISPVEVAVNEIESILRLKGEKYRVRSFEPWLPETEPGHLELVLTVIFPPVFVIFGSLLLLRYLVKYI